MSLQFTIERTHAGHRFRIRDDGREVAGYWLGAVELARLARAVAAVHEAVVERHEPPYVLQVELAYRLDGDQVAGRARHRTATWAFSTRARAGEALRALEAEIAAVDEEEREAFTLTLPPLPELDYPPLDRDGLDPALPALLAEFRGLVLSCFPVHHHDGASFWDRLTDDERTAAEEMADEIDLCVPTPGDPHA